MVDSVAYLYAASVVHFDLKLQNVYIEHTSGVGEDGSDCQVCYPPIHIVVGDFGESKTFPANSSGFTMRPLGTDFMKSPEMLRNGQHPMLHQRRVRTVTAGVTRVPELPVTFGPLAASCTNWFLVICCLVMTIT